jgi:hypothetical protein
MTAHDIDGTSDLVVSIPLPRWRTTRRILHVGLVAILFLALGATLLNKLLTQETVTVQRRGLLAALVGFSFVLAFVNLMILRLALKRPFAVLESGIELQGGKIPWEKIDNCHWGRYTGGILNLRTHYGRFFVPVPKSQRAAVEAALRRVGRWQD